MATLKAIRKQISGIKSTKKVTSAMKMIASVKLRKAIARTNAGATYKKELDRLLLQMLSNNVTKTHPIIMPPKDPAKPLDILIITSDRGLCGAFNENLFKVVEKLLASLREEKKAITISAFGRKGRDFLARKKIEAFEVFSNIQDVEALNTLHQLADRLKERYLKGESCGAVVLHNRLKGAGNYETVKETLLPLGVASAKLRYGIDYIYEPAKKDVFSFVIEKVFVASVFLAYLESFSSEVTARMVAMEMATKNAEELMSALTLELNKARQFTITRELTDIVGGAEAIKGN